MTNGHAPARSKAIVNLQGAMNCRDIGGYPTTDGKTVRMGAIFRCDRLSELTDDDLEELSDRGIRTVVDFRVDIEQEQDPSLLWPTVTSQLLLPIGEEIVQQKSFIDRIKAREVTQVTEAEVGEMYIEMLGDHTERWREFLTIVAELEHLPLLFHCTAGKDRTGLGAALIHDLLGVERELILDDFELTNTLSAHRRIAELRPSLEEAGVDVDAIYPALSAPRSSMITALDHINGEWGGSERWMLEAVGVDPEAIELLRMQMLI